MYRRLPIALGMAAALALPFSAAAKTELRLINSFDARQSATQVVVKPFIESVEKASNGEITIRASGPEVVKPFEQLQPTSRGVFDMMFTTQVYHSGTTSLGIAFYAIAPDPKAFRENGLWDALDKDYQRHNLKLLALVYGEGADTGAYQAVLKQPIGPSGDFTGLKLRGTKTYAPFIEHLNGAMVLLPGGEIYTSLEKGVIDGALWPANGALDFKWYEVAPYMARPMFGHSSYTLTMNMDRYKKLSAEERAVIEKEAELLEVTGMEAMDRRIRADVAKLAELGMKETPIDPAKFKSTMGSYWSGLWAVAAAHKPSTEGVLALKEIARKANMLK